MSKHVAVAEPVSLADMERMAEAVAASGFFKLSKEAALTLMMVAQAEGRHPVNAAMEYDIIEGRPALKSEKLLARFLQSGGSVDWHERTDKKCEATFSHPQGTTVTVAWTIDQAAKVTFYTKNGWKPLTEKANWRNYPRNMLQWRCVAEGVRASYPLCSSLTHTVEELQDGDTIEGEYVVENGSGFLRGAAKDKVVAMFTERMEAASSKEALNAIWEQCEAEYRGRISDNALYGLEVVKDECAHELDNPRVPEPDGDPALFHAMLDDLLGQEGKAAVKAWGKALNKDDLARLSDKERFDLRQEYEAKLEAEA